MPRGTKKPKDINAPKKNQSSYFIFSNERRGALQQKTGQSVTEISRIISGEWKEMDKEEKSKYEQQAAEQKKRYAEEWEAYKKTDNYTKYQETLKEWEERQAALGLSPGGKSSKKGGKAMKLKKPKQPEAMPKRPQSSYFIFSNKRRNELKEQYPDQRVTELSKLIASEWKLKSAEEKKMYEDEALENKEKYQEIMKTYKETEEYKEYINEVSRYKKAQKNQGKEAMEEDEDGEMTKISLPRKPKDEHCPKKPLSSYFLYAQSVREQTKAEHPNVNITQIAREISKKWKTLSEDDKKPYNEEAARLKEEYTKAIAEYEGSDEQKAFKKKLAEWSEECEARKQKARLKKQKKQAVQSKTKGKGKKADKPSPSSKGKRRKTSKSMDEDESEEESSSDSESESSSGSSSSGSSSSSEESSSESDSD